MRRSFADLVEAANQRGVDLLKTEGVMRGVATPKSQSVDLPAVRKLFSRHFQEYGHNVSNVPNGVPTIVYLIFGRTPRVDVRNQPEAKFRETNGFGYRVFQELIECRKVIPSLYERDANNWSHTGKGRPKSENDNLKRILAETIADGTAIENWLDWSQPTLIDFRREKSRRIAKSIEPSALVRNAPDDAEEGFEKQVRVVANRWAYLERYNKHASDHANTLLEGSDPQKFLDFLHLQKWYSSSMITAGMGQNFVIGPNAKKMLFRSDLSGDLFVSNEREEMRRHYSATQIEVMKYFFSEITGQRVANGASVLDAKRVVDFVKNRDRYALRNEINLGINRVWSLILDKKEPYSEIKDVRCQIADYLDAVEKDTQMVSSVKKAASTIAMGLHTISPFIEPMLLPKSAAGFSSGVANFYRKIPYQARYHQEF